MIKEINCHKKIITPADVSFRQLKLAEASANSSFVFRDPYIGEKNEFVDFFDHLSAISL
jgi:hypothetical protein